MARKKHDTSKPRTPSRPVKLKPRRERARERPTKMCPGCGEEYPRTTQYFHKHSGRYDGLQARCKTCHTSTLQSVDIDLRRQRNREYMRRVRATQKEQQA